MAKPRTTTGARLLRAGGLATAAGLLLGVATDCNAIFGISGLEYGPYGAGATAGGGSGATAGGAGGAGAAAGADAGGLTTGGGAGAGEGGAGGAQGGSGGGCVLGPFGPAELLESASSSYAEYDPSLSSDGLELYFASSRSSSSGGFNLWRTTRPSTASPFSTPELAAELSSAEADWDPDLSVDGLRIYFASTRPGSAGGSDLWMASRPSTAEDFGAPAPIDELNTAGDERDPSPSADELTLYFSRESGGTGEDIFVASRGTASAPFSAPVRVATVSSTINDANPEIAQSGLELLLTRPSTTGLEAEIWVATRPSVASSFGTPVLLTTVNSADGDHDPTLGGDDLLLVFASDRPGSLGGSDLWITSRSCTAGPP